MMATRVLANELSRWNITVNAVSISVTEETPGMNRMNDESPSMHVFEEVLKRQTFTVSKEDIAEVVTFFAGSDCAQPITGQTLSVNGGISFPG
jgi:3-oxoacyl-[acyl-carrier protein] reductase